MEQPQIEESKKRDRRLLLTSLILFVISGSIFSVYLYGQHEPMRATRKNTTFYDEMTPRVKEEARAKRIARVKMIREHWQNWALEHKELLTQMLNAQPHDQAMLARVYNALPQDPLKPGIPGFSYADLNSNGVQFGWQPIGKIKQNIADPLLLAKYNASQNSIGRRMLNDFAKHRDVELSSSMDIGPTNVTLWASGRVTEMTWIDGHVPGGPAFVEGEPQEIFPSYDFLKQQGDRGETKK